MSGEYWDELVASTVRGRRWVAAFDVLAGLGPFAERLARQGSEGLFVVAGSRGTGELPAPGLATWRLLDIVGSDLMDGIRRYEEALRNLPDDVVAAVDEFDPDREARVLRTAFAVDHPVAGRRCYGARPQEWVDRLEDKVLVDELWDAAGVARAPSRVVPASLDELVAASHSLDRGMGTVWAGDSRDGWHGGASHVRWVRDADSAATTIDFFRRRCERVRVMPFLDGIPCSIHGMVIGDEVLAFRPVELLILRRPGSGEFFYGGAATAWDPPDGDRKAMRRAAYQVGRSVRDRFGYQGAFNLDGVLTGEGWLPTELNARFAAGLAALQAHFEAPLAHLHMTIVEGEELDYRAADLERSLIENADANRRSGFGAPISAVIDEERHADVVFDDGRARFADEGEEADGSLHIGPGSFGGYLRLRVNQPVLGASSAPLAVAALALADAEWRTGIGAVEAASEVR